MVNKKPKKVKQERQVIWAVVLMISVILIVILVPTIKTNLIDKFNHNGLVFHKTGTNPYFFSTKIPIVDTQGQLYELPWTFRYDPRDLEEIPVDLPEDRVLFIQNDSVYVSFEANPPSCDDNTLAVVGVLNFLDNFLESEIIGGFNEEEFAGENNRSYITCENSPDNTVINLRSSDETAIKKVNDNCYEISYKDCEINKAVEKFEFVILEGYMKFFTKR